MSLLDQIAPSPHKIMTLFYLVDTSGSMEGEKLGSVNAAMEETIAQHLDTYGIPDPELMIRTGGEERISNFLLWQCAYSEFYFTKTYWPDFIEEELCKAICEYQQRQRRFGKTGEQVEEAK